MVAIDEASALRLEVQGTGAPAVPFQNFTSGLFTQACDTKLSQPTYYDTDLATLELRLQNPSLVNASLGTSALRYRIFTTNVIIRGAKWSMAETH